ncbi:MAG: GspE/PulE family protein, partial [Planctomycetota bacterium]
MKGTEKYLQLLQEKGVVGAQSVTYLREKYKKDAEGLIAHLIAEGCGSRNMLCSFYGDAIGFTYVDIQKTLFQRELIELLPEDMARKHCLIFLHRFGKKITTACADPANYLALEEVANQLGVELSPVYAMRGDILDAIDLQYHSEKEIEALTEHASLLTATVGGQVSMEQIRGIAGNEAMLKLVRAMILFALQDRASDIHIQPWETGVRVRFRIDGVLHERLKLESELLGPVVACLKIMAGADIMETRRPQDGRINFELERRSIDIRFSTVPTVHGEKVVMRLLGQMDRRDIPSLEELDFSAKNLKTIERVMDTPNGVFFVTGPTGSGKTTTLYAALKHINRPGLSITTVEDPIEYRLPGTAQVQVNQEIGLDFTSVLRSFLRQDPDVILLGEVRDIESAKIASQAALTGHLVLSTMHTNNSLQAVTRLVEIGVEPFLVAPSIIAVMAQRLVRRLCDQCKASSRLSAEETAARWVCEEGETVELFRPVGCAECHNTGYRGRLGVHEIFMLGDEVRQLISRNASI